MSKDSGKTEPSMDDILASIRRIIDEDGSKTRKPAAASGGKSTSDILDLTEMVNEDGSVTSLEKRSAAAPAQSKLIDDDEPPIYADREERMTVLGAPETTRPTLAGDPRAPNAPQPAVERPAQPASPPPQAQAAPRPPASPPPAPLQAQPMPNQPPRITPTPAMGSPISLTPVNTPATAPGLVSSQAANAATAAFDRLAQAALQQQPQPVTPPAPRTPSPTIGGRALEDMVSEMLRPMLQHWLDTNLPSIVERLVQQEIQKMNKR